MWWQQQNKTVTHVVVEVPVGDYRQRGEPRELWQTTLKLKMAQETLWNEAGLLNYKAGDTVPGHLMKENCYHPSADLNKHYVSPSLTSEGHSSAHYEGRALDVSLTSTQRMRKKVVFPPLFPLIINMQPSGQNPSPVSLHLSQASYVNEHLQTITLPLAKFLLH